MNCIVWDWLVTQERITHIACTNGQCARFRGSKSCGSYRPGAKGKPADGANLTFLFRCIFHNISLVSMHAVALAGCATKSISSRPSWNSQLAEKTFRRLEGDRSQSF